MKYVDEIKHCKVKNLREQTIAYYVEDCNYFAAHSEAEYIDEVNFVKAHIESSRKIN